MKPALAELLKARSYARALDSSVWDFAVEFAYLESLGLTLTDLRYLIRMGLVEHTAGTPNRAKSSKKTFRRSVAFGISAETCIVLTDAGADWLRALPPSGQSNRVEKPHWETGRRELLVGAHVVKRFRQPAPSQELILMAFEEEGWPVSILDPLPPRPGQDSKLRLRQTISNLNRWQNPPGIRFFGNGVGRTICWEWRVDSPERELDQLKREEPASITDSTSLVSSPKRSRTGFAVT